MNTAALTRMMDSKWWFYFYEYENSTSKSPKLIRCIFKIKSEGSDFLISLENTSEAYTSFSGKVTHAEDELLIIELTGGEKTKYLMLTIDESGASELYMGMYMKHDSASKLYSGSVILQRFKNGDDKHTAEVFEIFGKQVQEKVHPGIRKFFEKKSYVYNKTTRIYSFEDLENWIDRKLDEREESSIYDLYIAAPVLGLRRQVQQVEQAKRRVSAELYALTRKEDLDRDQAALLRKAELHVNRVLENEFIGRYDKNAHDHFSTQMNSIFEDLNTDPSFRIYYPGAVKAEAQKLDLKPASHRLAEDFTILKRSKAFLLVSPNKNIFSSVWVQAGWAMMLGIPLFLIYENKENLPFILRSSVIKENIEMASIQEINGLKNIGSWLRSNPMWKNLFH